MIINNLLLRKSLAVFAWRDALVFGEAGGEIGGVVEANLFSDAGDGEVGLEQQQLGPLNAEPHQIIEGGTSELLLHASGNVDRMKINALTKLLRGNILAVMLPQIRGRLLCAQGGRRRSLRLHRGGQVLNDLLENKLLLPFYARNVVVHIELHELAQETVHLGGLKQLGELGQKLDEGLRSIKA